MTEPTPEYFEERLKMITELEKVAQKGPKSSAAISAEVKQTRRMITELELIMNCIYDEPYY